MTLTLKRELNEVPLTATLPPSLDEQLRDFAKSNGVSKSAAVRYILASFLSSNSAESGISYPEADNRARKKTETV